MYYYNFNNDDENLYVAEVKKSERFKTIKDTVLLVDIKRVSGLKKTHFSMPMEAGKVFKRSFWLEKLDLDEARKVIRDYKEMRIVKANAILNSLKEERS